MEKNIVILSKSKKYKNYCVAGKDMKTREWIRLISENDGIHNAIEPSDLIYNDNTEANLLDIVQVTLKDIEEKNKNIYQPENYILDNCYYLTIQKSLIRYLYLLHLLYNIYRNLYQIPLR